MDFDNIRNYMDLRTATVVPGCDCMICRDHEEIFRYTSGYADADKHRYVEGNELYFLWSMSKVVTVSLAMKLYENGAFAMDDPISLYLPEFSQMKVKSVAEDRETIIPAKNPIRVRDLFAMTAGINYNISSKSLEEARKTTEKRCPTREMVRAMSREPLEFEPGGEWRYSLCHDVLGGLIEVVSGMRLRDYAKKVLFDPLEMIDTSYGLPRDDDKVSRLAVLYQYRENERRVVPTNNTCNFIFGDEYDSGGAGVISTCSDYMKFADALANFGLGANGYRFLSRDTVNLMRTNVLTDAQLKTFWFADCGYGYGYGVRTMIDKSRAGALSNIGEFGWAGAAGTYLLIDPQNHISMFYVQHMRESMEAYIHPRLRNVLYGCL